MDKKLVYEDFLGVEGAVVAEVLKDDGVTLEFGEFMPLMGLAELTVASEQSSSQKFYDNKPVISITSKGSTVISIDGSVIGRETLALITGEGYDKESGVVLEGSDQKQKQFALGYTYGNSEGERFHVVRYKGVFSTPEKVHKTRDDSTDSNGMSIEYTSLTPITKQLQGEELKDLAGINYQEDLTKTAVGREEFFANVLQFPELLALIEANKIV